MKKILLLFLSIALLQHCAESKYDPDFEASEFLQQRRSDRFQDDNEVDKINNEDREQYLKRRRNHHEQMQNDYKPRREYNDQTSEYDVNQDYKLRGKEYKKIWDKYSDKKKSYYNDKKEYYKNKKNDYTEKRQKYSNEFNAEPENREYLVSSEFDGQKPIDMKYRTYQNSLDSNEKQDLFEPRKEYRQKQNYHAKRDVHEKKYYNEYTNEITPKQRYADPPDHKELIPMARYVLHNSDWASIATISTVASIEGFPFSNVKSVVDGTIANSTGIPYFYMSPLDFTARDLSKNNRATVLVTLEETRYCEQKNYDAEDPRCTRLMLSGKMKKVKEGTPEFDFAKNALFERHPSMANFPADHDWFVAKLKIAQIAMVDWFGGAKYIAVRDYLAYNYTNTELPQFKHSPQEKVDITKLNV